MLGSYCAGILLQQWTERYAISMIVITAAPDGGQGSPVCKLLSVCIAIGLLINMYIACSWNRLSARKSQLVLLAKILVSAYRLNESGFQQDLHSITVPSIKGPGVANRLKVLIEVLCQYKLLNTPGALWVQQQWAWLSVRPSTMAAHISVVQIDSCPKVGNNVLWRTTSLSHCPVQACVVACQ